MGRQAPRGTFRSPGDHLQSFLRERIAAFKVPAHVWFREGELPRNPGGKILKTHLRAEILG